jgi:hypothetical protein
MEVHHPEHAIRSWRDFLSHMGTVFLGLILAIALEQSVEAWHRANERAELRAALDRDSRQAISDALRSEKASDDLAAWDAARIVQINAALKMKTILGPAPLLTIHDFDVATNPAFQAARSSGALALLPQKEILAYAEADHGADFIEKSFEEWVVARSARMQFEFAFGKSAGPQDYSSATPEDLLRYRTLVIAEYFGVGHFLHNTQQFRGVETALLAGVRDLPTLYKSERADTRVNKAMKVVR